MDYLAILKGTGIMIVFLLIVGALTYWLIIGFKKLFPNAKYFFKYTIFRRKYKEKDVSYVLGMIDRKFTYEDLLKYTLVHSNVGLDKAKELGYIYIQLKKIDDQNKDERRKKDKWKNE